MPDTPDDGSGPNIGGQQGSASRTPVPDPTVLTTQALYREVAALKELLELRIDATTQEYRRRLGDLSTRIDAAIAARDSLDTEVQKRTDLQFVLVEAIRVEQKKDTKDAIDAALTAQKEAIAKAETGTTKQIEQLQETFKTEVAGLRRDIDANKDRLGATELDLRAAITEADRKASDITAQRIGATTDRSGLYAAIGIIATLILVAIAIAAAIAARGG